MSKQEQLAAVVADKVTALYQSGNETQIAFFEAIMKEKAEQRGENPDTALKDVIAILGASLLNEKAAPPSQDAAVEMREVEKS